MSLRKRNRILALGLFFIVGAVGSGVAPTRPSRAFIPFVATPLPQRATGDFDGDGRADTAQIEQGGARPSISIELSGSSDVADVKASAAGLIEADVDHDGDFDLVAVTPAGELVILINDGHGRFTRQEPSHGDVLSQASFIPDTLRGGPAALPVVAPFVTPDLGNGTAVGVTQIRPPTAPSAFTLAFLRYQALRAPPGLPI